MELIIVPCIAGLSCLVILLLGHLAVHDSQHYDGRKEIFA